MGYRKRGFAHALTEAGVAVGATVYFSDEMRVGRRGQVRRRWGLRGVRLVQPLQIIYDWKYLLLGVDPMAGEVRWAWIDRMKQEQIAPVVASWEIDVVVWDGARPHHGEQIKALPIARIPLPPYCPELNPAERIFQEIRRQIEGWVYDTVEQKIEKTENFLRELAADPVRVRNLVGWEWIHYGLHASQAPQACAA